MEAGPSAPPRALQLQEQDIQEILWVLAGQGRATLAENAAIVYNVLRLLQIPW